MNLMQNVRRIGLVGLVLVTGSLSAFADTYFVNWDDGSDKAVTATVGATNGNGGTYGTEIKATNVLLASPVTDQDGATISGTPYITFDLKSTGAATGGSGTVNQNFIGSFSITNGAGGTVLVGGPIFGNITASKNASGTTASINLGAHAGTNIGNSLTTAFTGSLVTAGSYTTPFGLDLTLANVVNLTTTGAGATRTTNFTSASVGAGDVFGTPGTSAVPEPSTFALLGLGAAAMAFGAYRRRNAAV